ncbi:hypothetical protein POTOM_040809 [Populus tomentosa]|uniref:ER lumen protein-retaining receptor n=1 Tax=Populus tomentosa TaxID=118781 RepID=A0A8X7YQS9_POPTO|nr:hypothetical protein POTOM_040809 [Populus tomentosa]
MRNHPLVRRSYDKQLDTFRHHFLLLASILLALLLHEKFAFQEVNGKTLDDPGSLCILAATENLTYFYTVEFAFLLEMVGTVLWAFSIYLEAVAILPQLVLLQRSGNVDNLTGQYVFFLGCLGYFLVQRREEGCGRAYRAFYIFNWIYRYFIDPHFTRWIACVSGLVQTALYADFFYFYFISWKNNAKLQLPA